MLKETKFVEIRLSGSPPGDRRVLWHQRDREGIIPIRHHMPHLLVDGMLGAVIVRQRGVAVEVIGADIEDRRQRQAQRFRSLQLKAG